MKRSIVRGIDKAPISANDLPRPGCRWTPARKAVVISAVSGGIISLETLGAKYGISVEEFLSWQFMGEKYGISGLKATKLQLFRGK